MLSMEYVKSSLNAWLFGVRCYKLLLEILKLNLCVYPLISSKINLVGLSNNVA